MQLPVKVFHAPREVTKLQYNLQSNQLWGEGKEWFDLFKMKCKPKLEATLAFTWAYKWQMDCSCVPLYWNLLYFLSRE